MSRIALQRRWSDFWHEPVAAERLALVRIATAFALLTDQLFQYLPYLGYLFGPHGMGAAPLNDRWMAYNWRWPVLFFTTDDMTVISVSFALWVLFALALLVGFKTRWAALGAWFLTMCFFARNSNVKNGGDDIVQIALFLLMFMPSNRALAWDARKLSGPQTIEPWGVRLIQIQLCMMYTATGLSKLKGGLGGTWLQGTSLHYVFNDIGLVRWSYAQLPLPIWITAPAGYVALFWEVCFILLVLHPRVRYFALWYGIAFHWIIFLTMEVGWFSFYSMAWYPAWIGNRWFEQRWPVWMHAVRERSANLARRLRPSSGTAPS